MAGSICWSTPTRNNRARRITQEEAVMANLADQPGRGAVRAGWALSGLVILFFLMDGVMKFVMPAPVIETTAALGWPTDRATLFMLGLLALVPTALYAWPRTAPLGALLLTAYLGGAVATHVRIGSPLFSHILFGVYLGVFLWLGLWLRDPRVRALLPIAND
jgi:hypothetical protein